nr:MAG TPA: hypothetical protein [Caudoviricetes sp.]
MLANFSHYVLVLSSPALINSPLRAVFNCFYL